jgi:hypothetical protein
MLQIPGDGEKRAYTKFFDETCNFFLILFAMLMLQVCDEKHPGPAPDLIRIAEMDEAVRLTRSYHFFVRWDFLAILELVGYSGRGRKWAEAGLCPRARMRPTRGVTSFT